MKTFLLWRVKMTLAILAVFLIAWEISIPAVAFFCIMVLMTAAATRQSLAAGKDAAILCVFLVSQLAVLAPTIFALGGFLGIASFMGAFFSCFFTVFSCPVQMPSYKSLFFSALAQFAVILTGLVLAIQYWS